jgi:hypothetical protein
VLSVGEAQAFAPKEIGTLAHVREVASAVTRARQSAGISGGIDAVGARSALANARLDLTSGPTVAEIRQCAIVHPTESREQSNAP